MPYVILTANGEELDRKPLAGPTIVGRSVPLAIDADRTLLVEHSLQNGLSGEISATVRVNYARLSAGGYRVNWPEALQAGCTGAAVSGVSPPMRS